MSARRFVSGTTSLRSVRSTDAETSISSRTTRGCLPRAVEFLPGVQPWRCLCRVFSQMTRTTPLRFTTLHLSQMVLTDARTFITFSKPPHGGIATTERSAETIGTVDTPSTDRVGGSWSYQPSLHVTSPNRIGERNLFANPHVTAHGSRRSARIVRIA